MNVIRQTADFSEWLTGLKDGEGKGRVIARIEAAKFGNFGDCEPVGAGVSEMRIHFGPGYRVYFMREGLVVYLLLCGGDKSTQNSGIKKAKEMAQRCKAAAGQAAAEEKKASSVANAGQEGNSQAGQEGDEERATMNSDGLKITSFDAAEYLRDEESIAAFLNASVEIHDPQVLLSALTTVARARSMTELAQASGLGRESLYKALKPGAQPRYETIMKVVHALGVEMVFRPAHHVERGHSSAKRMPLARSPKKHEEQVLVEVPARRAKPPRKKARALGTRAAAKSEKRG
jgi:putative addiction module killer protein/probable addiction module antidote protein